MTTTAKPARPHGPSLAVKKLQDDIESFTGHRTHAVGIPLLTEAKHSAAKELMHAPHFPRPGVVRSGWPAIPDETFTLDEYRRMTHVDHRRRVAREYGSLGR